jgi:hypothetical protein
MASIIVWVGVSIYIIGIGLLVFAFVCADTGEEDDRKQGGGGQGAAAEPLSALSSSRRWLSRLLLRRAPAACLSLLRATLGDQAAEAVVSGARYAFYERNPILQVRFMWRSFTCYA